MRGGVDQDDSLTNMEWLPDVSIPYMQEVRCRITEDDVKQNKKHSRSLLEGDSNENIKQLY